MGIPAYYSHVLKTNPNIIFNIKNLSTNVDNFMLDANSIIYNVVYENVEKDNLTALIKYDKFNLTRSELEERNSIYKIIINLVIKKLDEYITIINADQVFISFDGVAPLAKMKQQKERRYKSYIASHINVNIDEYKCVYLPSGGGNINSEKAKINMSFISCGTDFMNLLSETIREYYYNKTNIIISCAKCAGEGEYKIFKFIREYADHFKNTSTVIYGLDADLIILSLCNLTYMKHVYLYKDYDYIKMFLSQTPVQGNYLINVKMYANNLLKLKLNVSSASASLSIIKTINLYDFIFISFLFGNDFVPHHISVNIRNGGIEKLLEIYLKTFSTSAASSPYSYNANVGKLIKICSPITSNICPSNTKPNANMPDKISYEFIWENIYLFFNEIAKDEYNMILHNFDNNNKMENIKRNQIKQSSQNGNNDWDINDIPTIFRDKEKYILMTKNNWEDKFYEIFFQSNSAAPSSQLTKQVIIKDYIHILKWCMDYYTGNKIAPIYYKYNIAPLFKDIVENWQDICFDKLHLLHGHYECDYVQPEEQLIKILPPQHLYLLPDKYIKINQNKITELLKKDITLTWLATTKGSKDLDDIYNWVFCRYLWEAHLCIPE